MSWLTLTQAAVIVGVDRRTIQRWCREGRIKARRTRGGHWRVTPEALASRPLTVAEAASMTGASERTVRSWLSSGRLAGRQLRDGSEWLISVDEMARFIAVEYEGGSR